MGMLVALASQRVGKAHPWAERECQDGMPKADYLLEALLRSLCGTRLSAAGLAERPGVYGGIGTAHHADDDKGVVRTVDLEEVELVPVALAVNAGELGGDPGALCPHVPARGGRVAGKGQAPGAPPDA